MLRVLLALPAIAAPLVLAIVLRMLPATDMDAAGIGWVSRVLGIGLLVTTAIATVACLVTALRNGSVAAMLLTGASATLAGGSVALASGPGRIPLVIAFAGGLAVAAALADRLGLLMPGRRARIVAGALLLLAAEAVAVAEIVPASAAALDGPAPALLAAGALLCAIATAIVAGRELSLATAALGVGATSLALARGQSAELALGVASLIGAGVLIARAVLDARVRGNDPTEVEPLSELELPLSDGILRFDGRLQLRSWNGAAATLLGLDDASAGVRLEELLGIPLAHLPADEETSMLRTPIGNLDAAIRREGSTITVVIRDPVLPSDADRLGRELRGTIEELLQARRTIDLQRAELDRATTVDPLTGVATRSAIIGRLEVEVAQARRYQHPVAVVLVDIDGFGEINRAHGIAGGDAVLREIALRVRLRVREADALGRSGSDALLGVLPHTDEVGAATFADALRRRIGQRPIVVDASDVVVTVSVGVAVMRPGEDLDLDGLLARVDEAMASARGAGGDRIALDRLHGLARLEQRAAEDPDDAGVVDGDAGSAGA